MKNNIFKIIIALLFLLIFNILFFVLGGTEQPACNWICYGFITGAYALLLMTPLLSRSSKGLTVLVASLYLRAMSYFFTELIVGVAFIIVAPESILWPLITQAILLTIFLILQLMSALANDATTASIEKQKAESIAIKSLAQQIRTHMRDIEDPMLLKKVSQCYEDINSSSIESFPEAQDAELTLRNAVEMLCCAIEDGDKEQIDKKTRRVSNALQDRNAIIGRCRIS